MSYKKVHDLIGVIEHLNNTYHTRPFSEEMKTAIQTIEQKLIKALNNLKD